MKKLLAILALTILATAYSQTFQAFTWPMFQAKEVFTKELKNGKLYLSWRTETPTGTMYPEGGTPPPIVSARREIYGCSNGVVVLEKQQEGIITNDAIITTNVSTIYKERIVWPD